MVEFEFEKIYGYESGYCRGSNSNTSTVAERRAISQSTDYDTILIYICLFDASCPLLFPSVTEISKLSRR